jgi:hypothetical protein
LDLPCVEIWTPKAQATPEFRVMSSVYSSGPVPLFCAASLILARNAVATIAVIFDLIFDVTFMVLSCLTLCKRGGEREEL